MPINKEYNETPHSPMEVVEQNPKAFIIEECIPACKELWKKNVYTFMVSDYLNEGECWIEVAIDNLSDENKEILIQMSGPNIRKMAYHPGCMTYDDGRVYLSSYHYQNHQNYVNSLTDSQEYKHTK